MHCTFPNIVTIHCFFGWQIFSSLFDLIGRSGKIQTWGTIISCRLTYEIRVKIISFKNLSSKDLIKNGRISAGNIWSDFQFIKSTGICQSVGIKRMSLAHHSLCHPMRPKRNRVLTKEGMMSNFENELN